ncbi:MAG: hypothetical protein IV100_21370 [Myxococcales bacterium]|nr:hypothetical protein [Myxococcales bacterium]
MKLTDIMSYADLTVFPEIALGIFLVVFVVLAARVLRPNAEGAAAQQRAAQIPLDDDTPFGLTQSSHGKGRKEERR